MAARDISKIFFNKDLKGDQPIMSGSVIRLFGVTEKIFFWSTVRQLVQKMEKNKDKLQARIPAPPFPPPMNGKCHKCFHFLDYLPYCKNICYPGHRMKRGSLHIGYWETYSFHFSCEGLAVELVAIISRRVGQSKLQEVKWPLNILIIAERQPLHKYYPFGSAMAPCFTNI